MSRLVDPVRALHHRAVFPARIGRTHIRRMTSRREFVEQATLSALGLMMPITDMSSTTRELPEPQSRSGFLDLLRMPDRVIVQTTAGNQSLDRHAGEKWTSDGGVLVTTSIRTGALHVALSAPSVAIKRLYLRWRGDMAGTRLIMGDAWERAYGDLEWRTWIPDRVMPWYFATHDGTHTNT